jgi:hypothetical protein
MNNAINQHHDGQIECLEFTENLFHGSSATALRPEKGYQIDYWGVAKLMHPSSTLRLKTQWPDREETGRATVSMIAVAARL